MKRISNLFLVFLMACMVPAEAQFHFFSATCPVEHMIYASYQGGSGTGSLRMPDGTIIMARPVDSTHLELLRFGIDGEVSSSYSITLTWPSVTNVSHGYALGEDKLLLTGTGVRPGIEEFFYVLLFDLTTLETKVTEYPIYATAYSAGPKLSVMGEAIHVNYPDYSRVALQKLDTELNSEWIKVLRKSPSGYGKHPSMCSVAMPDGRVLCANKDNSWINLLMLDSLGNQISMQTYTDMGAGYARPYGIRLCADGSFLLCGQVGFSPCHPILMRLEPDLSIRWSIILDDALSSGPVLRFLDVVELPDGRIAAFGSTTQIYTDNYFNTISFFEAGGDFISSQQIGDGLHTYYLYDVEAHADGFLMSGLMKEGATWYNSLIHTDFDLASVCHLTPLTTISSPFDAGPVVTSTTPLFEVDLEVEPVASMVASVGMSPALTVCNSLLGQPTAMASDDIRVGPNPLLEGQDLGITGLLTEPVSVVWWNEMGQAIKSESLLPGAQTLHTHDLLPGVYVLQLSTLNRRWIQKVVIHR